MSDARLQQRSSAQVANTDQAPDSRVDKPSANANPVHQSGSIATESGVPTDKQGQAASVSSKTIETEDQRRMNVSAKNRNSAIAANDNSRTQSSKPLAQGSKQLPEESEKAASKVLVSTDKEEQSERQGGSAVFQGDQQELGLKVSDILTGNFAPIEIPVLEIPGTKPLVYESPEALLAEIDSKDEFFIDEIEEEYLMFTAEIEEKEIRRQDGPHHTLRWRKKVRLYKQKQNLDELPTV